MATDIAFALAVLAVLGPRVPAALKLFVVAFAVADDLGAVALIAAVYTAEISVAHLIGAALIFGVLVLMNRPLRVFAIWPYLLGGCVLWYFLLEAGVHASIAGILIAFAIPFSARTAGERSPSNRLEHALHAPVAFVVLPLFALANTAIVIDRNAIASLGTGNGLGIVLGLVVGKPLGIILLCVASVRLRVCELPEGVGWREIAGAGLLGGIGFTMSIFISNLAFAAEPGLIESSKLAVLCASAIAGAAGLLCLAVGTRARHAAD